MVMCHIITSGLMQLEIMMDIHNYGFLCDPNYEVDPSQYVAGPEKTCRSYLHIKFDLNFNISNVISQLGNIASKFHHICTKS